MKPVVLIIVLLTLFVFDGHAITCKDKKRSVSEQLATLNPKFDFDLADLEMFPGGTIVSNYRYEVEPAYSRGLYQRYDKWVLEGRAIPADSFELNDNSSMSYSAGIETKNEASFIRYFASACQAMTAIPYAPTRMPLKAKIALSDKFQKGDYFTFKSSVGFVIGTEILSLLTSSGLWGGTVSANYLLEGFYQLHIVKQDATHLRVKVVAHLGKNLSIAGGLGYRKEFEFFAVNALNNQLEKLVNTKPIQVQGDLRNSDIFMVDYVLDLTDPEVVNAFERIIRKVKHFKNIQLTSAFKDLDIEKDVLLDLTPLEDLYIRDLNKQKIGRIKRNLQTDSEQKTYGLTFNAGNKLLGSFRINRNHGNASMEVKQTTEEKEKFLLKSWKRNWEGKLFYSLFRTKREDSLNALFRAENINSEILLPVNIVQQINHQKNKFSFKNFEETKILLKKALPLELYNEIPFSRWRQSPKVKYSNYGLRLQLVMTPKALLEAPELTAVQIESLFLDYMKQKDIEPTIFIQETGTEVQKPTALFRFYLRLFGKHLAEALDRSRSIQERLDKITVLRRNPLFIQSGFSFLMNLSGDRMKNLYHVDLEISSNEAIVNYTSGDAEMSALYKKILSIKAALDDDAYDLLREAESVSFPGSNFTPAFE